MKNCVLEKNDPRECPIIEVEGAPQEAKNGFWITKEPLPRTYGRPRAMCSRCGAFALYEMKNVGCFVEKLSKYCPSCGQKQDEEERA